MEDVFDDNDEGLRREEDGAKTPGESDKENVEEEEGEKLEHLQAEIETLQVSDKICIKANINQGICRSNLGMLTKMLTNCLIRSRHCGLCIIRFVN